MGLLMVASSGDTLKVSPPRSSAPRRSAPRHVCPVSHIYCRKTVLQPYKLLPLPFLWPAKADVETETIHDFAFFIVLKLCVYIVVIPFIINADMP